MCAYNSVNGTHACGNDYIQNTILKGRLGFQGAVVSDWGGTWNTEVSTRLSSKPKISRQTTYKIQILICICLYLFIFTSWSLWHPSLSTG